MKINGQNVGIIRNAVNAVLIVDSMKKLRNLFNTTVRESVEYVLRINQTWDITF